MNRLLFVLLGAAAAAGFASSRAPSSFSPAPRGDAPDSRAVAPASVDDSSSVAPQQAREAELPRAIPVAPEGLDAQPATVTVATGLQRALNAAKGGDVLCLPAGSVHRGTFTLPARRDTGWVVLRTCGPNRVGAGERMTPTIAEGLAVLETETGQPALLAAQSARGWYVTHLIARTADATKQNFGIVDFRFGSSLETMPRDLWLDRVVVHGHPGQPVRRGVILNSGAAAVVNSWIDEIHEKGSDAQCVWGYNGPGPYLIHNNTLRCVGENIMFGGADPRIPGLVPRDVTITRNHFWGPIAWKGRYSHKNLLETKNVERLLVEENVFEGSWAEGQTGYALVIKTSNQSGGCRWCSVADVTIRHNLIKDAAGVFNVTGASTIKMIRDLDSLTRRITIAENYAVGIGEPPFTGVQRFASVYNNAQDITLRRNTFESAIEMQQAFQGADKGQRTATRLRVERNVWTRSRYVLGGCPGDFAACVSGGSFAGNVFAQPKASGRLPSGFAVQSDLRGAIGRGAGISRAAIDARVRGVVVAR